MAWDEQYDVGMMCVVKWIREWTTEPEVGVQVQDQVSKQESLEYAGKCVVEGVGMRVCMEATTWKKKQR